MSTIDWEAAASSLGARFGLRPLPGWGRRLARGARELARTRGEQPAALVARALEDDALRRELVAWLTVDETFFFRHPEQLCRVAEHVASALAEGGAQRRVWSAGCSSGEEPYSLAIVLRDRLGRAALGRIRILGSDLDGRAIAAARAARYGPWSFRGVAPGALRAGDFARARVPRTALEFTRARVPRTALEFTRARVPRTALEFASRGDPLEVSPHLRERVSFVHAPLEELARVLPSASFDAILFRNVAIYLTPEALARLHASFARVLRPGGILVTSYADPAPPASLFRAVRTNGVVHHELRSAPARAPTRAAQAEVPTLVSALARADRGALEEAHRDVSRLLQRAPTEPVALFARARIAFGAGRVDQALRDLRAALFLEPRDALARYWYSLVLEAKGHGRAAAAHARACRALVGALAPTIVLSDGRTNAEELGAACSELARRLG